MSPPATCQICGGLLGRPLIVKEMMYGTSEPFAYAECGNCGCVQMTERPVDLSPFYPTDYHSYRPEDAPVDDLGRTSRRWLSERLCAVRIGRAGVMWRLFAKLRPSGGRLLPSWTDQLPELSTAERILDIGCGAGHLLRRLAIGHYRTLVGLDPFLPTATLTQSPVRLVKQSVDEYLDEPFDVVMLHHSLEHLPDQKQALASVRRLLAPGGVCLVRVPLASGRPRQVYQADWVEFDAPRHLFLHTRRSLSRLAAACALRIDRSWDDSHEFAYWASELYRRGMSLYDPVTQRERDPLAHFTKDELETFRTQARRDNELGAGGRAAFVLRRDDN